MKRKITLLFAMLFAIVSYGQIDKEMMKKSWKPGKEKEIYGNQIKKHLGKNDGYGMTNVGYQTVDQLVKDLEQKADDEMWTPEKKNETIESFKKFAVGGLIHLYITRLTIDAANTEMFTVIVKDSEDNEEIFRKELKSDIPHTPSSGSNFWWNYTSIPINVETGDKVFIYIVDRLGRDNNKHKFEVIL